MERVMLPGGSRRPKWQYPQTQQAPRILQLPGRPRRKVVKSGGKVGGREKRGRLEVLFDQEREFSGGIVREVVVVSEEERRGRVEEIGVDGGGEGSVVVEEEKWRFQAEMLRAECNLLRIEREVAVKKMERRRVQAERILRSAIQTLVSGRIKICSGEDVSMVLENEIMNLTEKLEKLQRRSRTKYLGDKNCSNFDKQASLLQQRLVKVEERSDEICAKEIREMAEASLSIQTSYRVDSSSISNDNCHLEILRRKMEGLSQGILLERMEEEYGSMISTKTTSASTSKRIEFPETSSILVRQPYKEAKSLEENKCCGHCKALVRRMVEQVRAETEQWSQMQETLGQVREEIEELQASRDFWEDHALDSDEQIQSLVSAVQEWKQKALCSEAKANEVQAQVKMLQKEIARLRKEQDTRAMRVETSSHLARSSQNETEKVVVICGLKENDQTNYNVNKQEEALNDRRRKALVAPKQWPLQDIGNRPPLTRQNSRAIFPYAQTRF